MWITLQSWNNVYHMWVTLQSWNYVYHMWVTLLVSEQCLSHVSNTTVLELCLSHVSNTTAPELCLSHGRNTTVPELYLSHVSNTTVPQLCLAHFSNASHRTMISTCCCWVQEEDDIGIVWLQLSPPSPFSLPQCLRVPEGSLLRMLHTDGGKISSRVLKSRPWSSSPENKIIHSQVCLLHVNSNTTA